MKIFMKIKKKKIYEKECEIDIYLMFVRYTVNCVHLKCTVIYAGLVNL